MSDNDAVNEDTEQQPLGDGPGVAWPFAPVPMPGLFDVVAQEVDGQSVLIIVVYTPSGATFAWLPRENALEFASRLKKEANTGPSGPPARPIKQEAPKSAKSKLIVPGGTN